MFLLALLLAHVILTRSLAKINLEKWKLAVFELDTLIQHRTLKFGNFMELIGSSTSLNEISLRLVSLHRRQR